MPTEDELEQLTDRFLNDMIKLKGVDFDGRKAEQTEVVGIVVECGKSDCVSCKNVLQD